MRCLFGFLCVCALGVVPLVGCGDTDNGDGGNGGSAGTGGSAGSGGTGGDGGTGGSALACDDGVCPCNEAGIRAAIASGCATVPGVIGPELAVYTFDCEGPQTVVTQDEIVIDNCVILDGEGKLTVDANGDHRVFSVAEDALAELRGLTVTGGFLGSDADCDNRGSGIHNRGTLFVVDSTLFGNRSADGGSGAISNSGGQLTLVNSTVSGNDGGIHICDGEVNVSSSTVIADDRAIWPEDLLSGVFADNSLIVGECSSTELPVVLSLGQNIESPGNTCGFERETDQANVSAEELELGPLADNGGGTKTHALLPGSVAIDATPAQICEVLELELLGHDQRGVARPKGTGCDVGAFESGQTGIKPGLWLGGDPASNTDGTPFDTGWAICFYVNVDGTFLIPSTDCDIDVDDEEAYLLELSWKNDVGAGTVQGEVGVCNANPEEDSESIGIGDSSGLIGTLEHQGYVPIEDDSFVIYPEVPGTTGYEIPGTFNGNTARGTASWVWSPGMGFSQCELDGGWTASPVP